MPVVHAFHSHLGEWVHIYKPTCILFTPFHMPPPHLYFQKSIDYSWLKTTLVSGCHCGCDTKNSTGQPSPFPPKARLTLIQISPVSLSSCVIEDQAFFYFFFYHRGTSDLHFFIYHMGALVQNKYRFILKKTERIQIVTMSRKKIVILDGSILTHSAFLKSRDKQNTLCLLRNKSNFSLTKDQLCILDMELKSREE